MVALLIGLIIGIAISIPIGPINVNVISRGLKQGFSNAFAVGLGASLMDLVYCGASMLGLSAIVHKIEVNIIFQVIGFLLLIYLGIRDIRTKADAFRYENEVQQTSKFHSAFLVGVFMYVSNPALVAFWITLSGVVQSTGTIIEGIADGALFTVGVGFGTALWYYLLLKAVLWKRDSFKAETLTLLSKVSGYIMLGFSAYIGYEVVASFIQHGV